MGQWTPNDSMFGNFQTKTFQEVFPDDKTFLDFYENNGGIPVTIAPDTTAKILYYLLYSRYGNDPIASSDVNRFKWQIMSIIFKYGPTWERRLEIQEELRGLTLEELQTGTLAVTNNALNPGNKLSTVDELIKNVNQQSRTNYKKGYVEAYAQLNALLETDVTENFLAKFKPLFIKVAMPGIDLWYETEVR